VLACLAGGSVLPGAASAAPESERGLLVVEGQGGTTTTVEVEQEVVFRDPRPELSGGRSHAAVLIESAPDAPRPHTRIGAVRVTAFNDGTGQALGVLGFDGRLRPGSYRVTLLGDGPVRAALQLGNPDGPGLRVVPRTPSRTQFLGRAERLPSGDAAASVDLPRSLPKDRRAIQVLLLAEAHLDEVRMCATTGEQCPQRVVAPVSGTGGEPQILAQLVQPFPFPRGLHWSVEGYRLADDRLRAAAIVF
jgi:hypothetical protein